MIYLGNTVLDSDYSLVSFYAESAYSFDGKANELVSTPPFELGKKYERELSDTTLEFCTSKLYDIYDEYELRSIFWQYWHAVCSPAHSAPVLIGASIEALSKAIKSKNSEKIQSRLIPKDKWRELQKQIVKMLEGSTIDLEAKQIMKNKLGLLNEVPKRELTKRFYDFLGLEFTIAESVAWERRNQSAHGEFISHDDYIGLIRDVQILKVLLHRLIIKVSECSNNYIDYYSLGHPTRGLNTGIPTEAQSSS